MASGTDTERSADRLSYETLERSDQQGRAESIARMSAPGPEPHGDGDPIQGTVLRLDYLYGPGTGVESAQAPALHVDAAAVHSCSLWR